jgi:hypothetical protein
MLFLFGEFISYVICAGSMHQDSVHIGVNCHWNLNLYLSF